MKPVLAEYEALEARVLGALREDLSDAEFAALALEIHDFQLRWNAPYAAWCATQSAPQHWQEIPAVPQAMFKRFRLSCFPPELVTKTFRTSGTTGETRGEHHLRDTRLYDAAVVAGWDRLRLPDHQPVFLSPSPLRVPDASLFHMFGVLGEARFHEREFGRGFYMCGADGRLDHERLKSLFRGVIRPSTKVAIFGTALSFLNFFEWIGRGWIAMKKGSYAVETGGFKGSGRDIPKAELYAMFEERLRIPANRVWNEYGMCELASQFYTRGLGAPHTAGPWVKATVISPRTCKEVAIGETGILRIFDLANVGSVLAIETADLAIRRENGFELLGRDPGATPRGCSRAADEAMRATSRSRAEGEGMSALAKSERSWPRPPGKTHERAKILAQAAERFPFLGPVTAEGLLELVQSELGHREVLDGFVPRVGGWHRAIAPGSTLHVLSGNTPAAALQSLLRGLLLGTHNRCKLPARGLPEVAEFVAALPREWRTAVEMERELPDSWLTEADAVIAFGNDETIAHFQVRVRPGQIFIPHGHKLSLGLIFEDPDFTSAPGAARDASVFDQQGCLSSQVYFVRETGALTVRAYAVRLAEEMRAFAEKEPPGELDLSAANAVRSLREEIIFRASNGEPLELFASDDLGWTVIADSTPGFPTSPLNRVIFVKPLREDLAETLAPLRPHLSTIGIWPSTAPHADFALGLGALRICAIGHMQAPPLTWHQDGMPVLAPLVRWVDWES